MAFFTAFFAGAFFATAFLTAAAFLAPAVFYLGCSLNAGSPNGLSAAERVYALIDAQPQVEHRNTFGTVDVEGIGSIPLFNLTAKFEKTPGAITAPPPKLAAHTAEVLATVGVTAERLAELKSKGIV